MTKTPEQLVAIYTDELCEELAKIKVSPYSRGAIFRIEDMRMAFLTGCERSIQCNAVIDTNSIETSTKMNSPEKQDSCEHILDMEKMVDADKVMDFNKGNFAKMEKVNMKFAYDSFPVTDKQAQDVKQIRENFSLLSDVLTHLVPNGRYLSIVQTKLEEACMFAVKGITHQAGDYGNLQNKA